MSVNGNDEIDEWNSLADPYICSWNVAFIFPPRDEVPEFHLINAVIELIVILLVLWWIVILTTKHTSKSKWKMIYLLPIYKKILKLYLCVTIIRFITLIVSAIYLKFKDIDNLEKTRVVLPIMDITSDTSLIWIQVFLLFLLAQTSGLNYIIFIHLILCVYIIYV